MLLPIVVPYLLIDIVACNYMFDMTCLIQLKKISCTCHLQLKINYNIKQL